MERQIRCTEVNSLIVAQQSRNKRFTARVWNTEFEACAFVNCVFEQPLTAVVFQRCTFENCVWNGVRDVRMVGVTLSQSRFEGECVRLSLHSSRGDLCLSNASVEALTMDACRLRRWSLGHATVRGLRVRSTTMEHTEAEGSTLRDCSLSDTRLGKGQMRSVCVARGVWKRVEASGLDLREARMMGVDLVSTVLRDALAGLSTWVSCTLDACDCGGLCCPRAKLAYVRWTNGSLRNASFTASTLYQSCFDGCLMRDVRLVSARLERCKLVNIDETHIVARDTVFTNVLRSTRVDVQVRLVRPTFHTLPRQRVPVSTTSARSSERLSFSPMAASSTPSTLTLRLGAELVDCVYSKTTDAWHATILASHAQARAHVGVYPHQSQATQTQPSTHQSFWVVPGLATGWSLLRSLLAFSRRPRVSELVSHVVIGETVFFPTAAEHIYATSSTSVTNSDSHTTTPFHVPLRRIRSF